MNAVRSNVHMTSNVYPVNVRNNLVHISENSSYVARIQDKAALRKIVALRWGEQNTAELWERYARQTPGFEEWQVKRINHVPSCVHCEPGDASWGLAYENGRYVEVCKCQNRSCEQYATCRPKVEKPDARK